MKTERHRVTAGWFLIGIFCVMIAIGWGFSLVALKRPCRKCHHPPHVERVCGVEVKSGAFKGLCSCAEDR